MAKSQNGYPVIESSNSKYLVNIPKIIGKVRSDCGVPEIFTDLIIWMDTHVEDLDKGADEWGYSYRPIRGQSTGFSNHASGTAIDLNAMQHPRGKVNTFSAAQQAAIRKRLKETYKGVIRWGGDYDLRLAKRDDMHFEIDAPAAEVLAVVKSLGDPSKGSSVKPAPSHPKPAKPAERVKENSQNSKSDNIAIAKLLNSLGYDAGYPDGVPGPRLRSGVKAFQAAQLYFPGMKADGNWGPMTQEHWEWVKELQAALDDWNASQRLGWLVEDGDYRKVTGQHVEAVQRANPDLYRKANAGKSVKFDQVAGPVFCKMIGIRKHPSA